LTLRFTGQTAALQAYFGRYIDENFGPVCDAFDFYSKVIGAYGDFNLLRLSMTICL